MDREDYGNDEDSDDSDDNSEEKLSKEDEDGGIDHKGNKPMATQTATMTIVMTAMTTLKKNCLRRVKRVALKRLMATLLH